MSETTVEKKKYRSTKNAYYKANSAAINKAKLIKQLVSGSRSPSLKTLAKYNLLDDDTDGKCPQVVIPNRPKFRILDNFTKPDTIVIKPQNIITPTQMYDLANTNVTGKAISDWVLTVCSTLPKSDGRIRSKKTLLDYANLPYRLSEIREQDYDENKNITTYFMNANETIQAILNWLPWSASTKGKFLQGILYLTQNFPPLKAVIHPDVIKIYEAEQQKQNAVGSAEQLQRKNANPVFIWSYIRRMVREKYGINSYEYLMILLFNQVHSRDDLAMTMAYKPADMTSDKVNYLLLDRPHKRATVFLNTYKTESIYGKQVIILNKSTYDVIAHLHPDDTENELFPMAKSNKLGVFIGKTFRNIPQLANEKIGIRYLRHSLVSSALFDIKPSDPDYGKKVAELAAKTFHTVKAQQHSYLSPLKDGKGKILTIDNTAFKKNYDEVTELRTGDEPDDSDSEEVSSKPRKEALMRIAEEPPKKKKPVPKIDIPIGTMVRKMFMVNGKRRWYYGKVIKYDKPYYQVQYSDGDQEELEYNEIVKYIWKKK